MESTTFSTKIKTDTAQIVDLIARQQGITRSRLINRAIAQYLQNAITEKATEAA